MLALPVQLFRSGLPGKPARFYAAAQRMSTWIAVNDAKLQVGFVHVFHVVARVVFLVDYVGVDHVVIFAAGRRSRWLAGTRRRAERCRRGGWFGRWRGGAQRR